MLRLGRLVGITLAAWIALAPRPVLGGQATVRVYKSATCECCAKWVEHLKSHGFAVQVTEVPDVDRVKREHKIPDQLASCHTATVGNYYVEGHVPAEDVKRLLKEHPRIAGLAVPGMPIGSPGMEGPNPEPYDVLAVDAKGGTKVFASHRP
jgi:hypothetical protein